MDRISGLPDELLLRILSFVPTKVAVSTSILSKRWEFLWMWLPKLEFRNSSLALRDFIDKNLPLHRAPVIESFLIDLYDIKPEDIKRWVEIAVSRYVRELGICYDSDSESIFPSSFCTCTSLVILKLSDVTLININSLACLPSLKTLKLCRVDLMDVPDKGRNRIFSVYSLICEEPLYCKTQITTLRGFQEPPSVTIHNTMIRCLPNLSYSHTYTTQRIGGLLVSVPSMVCLPSLKTLELENVFCVSDESLQRLLSVCPVLEDLSVDFSGVGESMEDFTVIVPSLQHLSLFIDTLWIDETEMIEAPPLKYLIDTPSLKYFKLKHRTCWVKCSEIKDMPMLREAYIDAILPFPSLGAAMRSITSVKRLTLCFSEIDVDGDGFLFNQLEHLKLCVCNDESLNLLALLLKYSPNLRVLDIFLMEDHHPSIYHNMGFWNQLSPVSECLLSSLQILNWSRYSGRPQERDVAVYILKNARHLRRATVLADTYDVPEHEMIKELALSSRASRTCEVVFVEDHTRF